MRWRQPRGHVDGTNKLLWHGTRCCWRGGVVWDPTSSVIFGHEGKFVEQCWVLARGPARTLPLRTVSEVNHQRFAQHDRSYRLIGGASDGAAQHILVGIVRHVFVRQVGADP